MPLDEHEERLIRLDEQVKRNTVDIKEQKDALTAFSHSLSAKINGLSTNIHKIQMTLSESRGKSRVIIMVLTVIGTVVGSLVSGYFQGK